VLVKTIARVNGEVLPFALFQFTLTTNTFTDLDSIQKRTIKARTDKNGVLRVRLWDLSEGIIPTKYVLREPDGTIYNFIIDSSTPNEVELSSLKLFEIPVTTPSYNAIYALVQTAITNFNFPLGGNLKDVLTLSSINPKVVSWESPDINLTEDLNQIYMDLLES
jgi:hypothetical protein